MTENELEKKDNVEDEKSEEKTELTEPIITEKTEDKLDKIECELTSLYDTLSKISEDLDSRKKELITINKTKDMIRALDNVVFELDEAIKTLDSTLLDLNEVYVYCEHSPFLREINDFRKLSKDITNIKCEIIRNKERMNRERFINIKSISTAKYFNMR